MKKAHPALGNSHPSNITLPLYISPETPRSEWHVVWRAGGGSLRYGQPPHIRRYTSLKDGSTIDMKMPGSGRTWHRVHGVTGFRAIQAYAAELNRKQVAEPPVFQRRVLADLPPAKRIHAGEPSRAQRRAVQRGRDQLIAEIELLKGADHHPQPTHP